MIYFTTRKQARTFTARKDSYKVVDQGTGSDAGKRWGVKVF